MTSVLVGHTLHAAQARSTFLMSTYTYYPLACMVWVGARDRAFLGANWIYLHYIIVLMNDSKPDRRRAV